MTSRPVVTLPTLRDTAGRWTHIDRPVMARRYRPDMDDANAARLERAASRTVRHAQVILDSGVVLTAWERRVLTARVEDPWASLTELAAGLRVSKGAYAGALRRVLSAHPVTDGPP